MDQKNRVESLLRSLCERALAFHPIFVKVFGGVNEAILFQQIHYWSDKGRLPDNVIYKTDKQIEDETTLTTGKQHRARKRLKELRVLKVWVQRANGTPVNHYQIDYDMLYKRIMDFYKVTETSITESTTEKTTEITANKHPSYEGIPPLKREFKIPAKQKKEYNYKDPRVLKIKEDFLTHCKTDIGSVPAVDVAGHQMIWRALTVHKLTEPQILDLFDEWFGFGYPDDQTVQITRALSTNQVNGYKARYGI
jgi:hypothetical protein